MPTRESGTTMLGMAVAQTLPRNTKTTSITRMTDTMRVNSTSLTEPRIIITRSSVMSR